MRLPLIDGEYSMGLAVRQTAGMPLGGYVRMLGFAGEAARGAHRVLSLLLTAARGDAILAGSWFSSIVTARGRAQIICKRTQEDVVMNYWMRRTMWMLLFAVILALGACVAPAAPPANNGAPAAEKMTIKLAANPWPASELNVAVAKILIEGQLGYPVEIIEIDENAQWPALATGDLHASLEVWPSGHAENIATYIDGQHVVENGGPLGVIGKIGWYIPSYLLAEHPELATWEGFTRLEAAQLFATAETGERGQFLAGDPSWVQYDADIIKNLGMNFQVVTAGSEDALLAAVAAAYSRQEPILFYFYKPHAIFAQYDLTEVALPPYSEECYAGSGSGGVACDYPDDVLFKIFWAGLQEAAPDVHTLLRKLNYDTDTQIGMIAAVELGGQSVTEAAQSWVDANEGVWRQWLPQ
jgi:glycine betaine/proline transport system substrate-binding protein